MKLGAEPADKPGSVVDSHSSRRTVTRTLKQPTRRHCGPQHSLPIWSCSRWGLPCRSVARLAVRSYRTISPLPVPCHPFAVSVTTCRLRRQVPKRHRSGQQRQRGDRAIGGIFLLHFPSARAAQALPGTVPCGARTFLGTARPERHPMTRLSGRLRRCAFYGFAVEYPKVCCANLGPRATPPDPHPRLWRESPPASGGWVRHHSH